MHTDRTEGVNYQAAVAGFVHEFLGQSVPRACAQIFVLDAMHGGGQDYIRAAAVPIVAVLRGIGAFDNLVGFLNHHAGDASQFLFVFFGGRDVLGVLGQTGDGGVHGSLRAGACTRHVNKGMPEIHPDTVFDALLRPNTAAFSANVAKPR